MAGSARAWGRLLRLSLAPSAVADVLAGHVACSGAWRPSEWLGLALASLCLYHGGLALNDWADRAHDARTRPGRALPSAALDPRHALTVALLLLALGAALAALLLPAPARWIPVALLAAILVYDLLPRGAWTGPLLLGTCRGLNLALGWAAAGPLDARAWVPLSIYALYVIAASRIGRLEDGPQETIAASRLRAPFALASAALLALAWAPWNAALAPALRLVAVAAAVATQAALVGVLTRSHPWTRSEVEALTGALLRRLLVCSALIALSAGTQAGALAAGLILCGYPFAFFLRRIFPPS